MFIKAKYRGRCRETNKPIDIGEECFWDREEKAVYCQDSHRYGEEKDKENIPQQITSEKNDFEEVPF